MVASWGKGEDGQLGHGDAGAALQPRAIQALVDRGITVRLEQKVWGACRMGAWQLGHGDAGAALQPRAIQALVDRGITVRLERKVWGAWQLVQAPPYSFGPSRLSWIGGSR